MHLLTHFTVLYGRSLSTGPDKFTALGQGASQAVFSPL